MRAGPLSDPSVAAFLRERFVCAWEKKGAVEVYRNKENPGQTIKLGGNILTYVCTPDGKVIHALPGASTVDNYRADIEWACTLFREASAANAQDVKALVRKAHLTHGQEFKRVRAVHNIVGPRAFSPIDTVERYFFEQLLGQTYAPAKEIVIREVDQEAFGKVIPLFGG